MESMWHTNYLEENNKYNIILDLVYITMEGHLYLLRFTKIAQTLKKEF